MNLMQHESLDYIVCLIPMEAEGADVRPLKARHFYAVLSGDEMVIRSSTPSELGAQYMLHIKKLVRNNSFRMPDFNFPNPYLVTSDGYYKVELLRADPQAKTKFELGMLVARHKKN